MRAFTCEAAGMLGAYGEASWAAPRGACRGPACRAPSDPCPCPWARAPCPCAIQPMRHMLLHSRPGERQLKTYILNLAE